MSALAAIILFGIPALVLLGCYIDRDKGEGFFPSYRPYDWERDGC